MAERRLEVGARFSDRDEPWPQTPHLWLGSTPPVFALFLAGPTPSEVAGVHAGKVNFAWIDTPLEGYLLSRFDPGLPWSDCPYSPHREGVTPDLPKLAPGEHLPMAVILVDATSGLIVALRMLTWPAQFVNVVQTTVLRLAAEPFRDDAARAAQDQLYAQYPGRSGTARWARERATATCSIPTWKDPS